MHKPPPDYSLDLVLHPAHDRSYTHFENASANPFVSNPATGVPRVNAWWLADAALLTYWAPDEAIPIFKSAGFECEFISEASSDCYVAWQKDFVVVAFRGTEPDEWKDVLADVNIVLAPWATGLVHLGFLEAFERILPKLDPLVHRLVQGRTLWCCGHSLGAALATLAADHYSARGACTFGSPRVGDLVFANAFSRKLSGRALRYVNDHDVVTHVPPPIGYVHVDERRIIAPDGTISDGPPRISHFFEDLIGKPRQLLEAINALKAGHLQTAPTFLLDHMPKAYAIWTWNDYDANH